MDLYWYSTQGNTDWDTLIGNWWTDSAHTSQASQLPLAGVDNCYLLGDVAPTVTVDDGIWAGAPATIDSTGLAGGAMFTVTSGSGSGFSISGATTITGDMQVKGPAVLSTGGGNQPDGKSPYV